MKTVEIIRKQEYLYRLNETEKNYSLFVCLLRIKNLVCDKFQFFGIIFL
jgi:hypothetical protein